MPTSRKSPVEYRFVRRRWTFLFRLVDAIGYALVRFWSRLRRRGPSSATAEPERVLLIQLDHLGDAVLTTALLPGLRRLYRRARIDVLAAPWNAAVFAARSEVNVIHVSRWNRFHRGRAWLWPISLSYWALALRKGRYDVAIDVRGDFTIAALATLAGIPRRVGWPCAGGGFFLTDEVPYEPGRHEVESRRAILAALGAATPRMFGPSYACAPEADRFVTHMLGDFRRNGRPLLVFHVGAGTAAKSWPAEHWRELIGRAVVDLDANVVLVGGNSEVAAARRITEDRFWPNVMDWTGRLTIDQLAALARRADVFVGADSGPAHLAAATGTTVVVLFSGTGEARQWRPWGDKVHVVSHDVACAPCYCKRCPLASHPCMTEITPQRVVDALQPFVDGPMLLPFAVPAGEGPAGGLA
jgi:lipopolysaccharide heptosyltransferase II